MKKIFAFLSLWFLHSLYAGHPLVTDDAVTIGKKYLQLEITPEFFQSAYERDLHVPIVLTWGMGRNKDLVITIPYCLNSCQENQWKTTSYFENPAIECKWVLFSTSSYSFGLKSGFAFQSLFNLRPSFVFIESFQLTRWILHFNQGINANSDVLTGKWLWHFSTAFEFPVSKNLNMVFNLGIDESPERNAISHPAYMIQGVQYQIQEKIMMDFGVRVGLNSAENYITLLTGLTALK